ncbi:MAG: CpsD/CapB family tyrosine-protein kinase [Planctomycetes bacterium]|nr:CpsD/CapB family tyrosine-protein kinase [Planctomycetota bacterium]
MSVFRRSPPGSGPLPQAEPDESRKIRFVREEIALAREPRGPIAEQFRQLRNSIAALNPEGAPRTIVVTSAARGEGKTVATINLGLAMCEVPGTRVLLVDADLHRPALEEYLGLPRRQGLVEVVRGTCPLDRAIRPTSVEGLSVLGPGELPKNPSELLGSERVKQVLGAFKQRFRYILIDTPEAAGISDASLLGALADGILLVVRLWSTPRNVVEETYNRLEALGGNVLGTVLTGAAAERPGG